MSDNKIELPGIFAEGYGVVPKMLMKAKDINSNTKLILCYLLSYTGSGHTCFPSMDTMAKDLNMSKRTIVRCISEAANAEYLSKKKNHLGYGKGTYNIYNLIFMGDFASDKIAHAKSARAKNESASDKSSNVQVTPGNCNNNSNNNNNNNSGELTDLRNRIRDYFEKSNPDYYHDGKQIGSIETIIKKSRRNEEKIFQVFNKHIEIQKQDKGIFWKNDPHTPDVISRKWDSIIAYKLFVGMKEL